ncbi:C40 family peptidase [Cellulophaga sp. HaHaR_3_176]|uniref:C40 family peptidase n=1 Tax=Cellulophaga sp. HaHaR_3_176 TaxID=1942464 RepID=UPI001C1FD651|nr:C40 family peptidase [Cellulophaga sp. HaHaR_3_176]QWX83148.1 C40 family peptidase [Cellulophaga sp. HaHaR_3_176]
MNRKFIYLLSSFLIVSCGASKKKISSRNSDERKITVEARNTDTSKPINILEVKSEKSRSEDTKVDGIINSALAFSGTRYKYGGTTKKGMDCSGLLYVAFNDHDVSLPRVSYVMAEEGENIKIKNVDKGDLLFFKTSKKSKKINHVGLVVSVDDGEIKFIHSTSSRGVIVSSLKEGYWNYAFIKATRVL